MAKKQKNPKPSRQKKRGQSQSRQQIAKRVSQTRSIAVARIMKPATINFGKVLTPIKLIESTLRSVGHFIQDLGRYTRATAHRIKKLIDTTAIRFLTSHPELLLIVLIIAAVAVFQLPVIKKTAPLPGVIEPIGTWCSQCRATSIRIPAIDFHDESIAQMQFDESQKTWPTPVTGIATPKETVTNNIIIFGHSKWFGNVSKYAAISKLKVSDEIIVVDQFGKEYTFIVKNIALVDRNVGDAVHKKDSLTVTLLTSARYNGEWLLPTPVDSSVQDTTKNPQDYAILVITAQPK